MYRIQKAVHFLNRIGYQYCLEVIAVFQSAADAGGNGVYIFKHRTVFDAGYVVADGSLDEAASQTAGEDACFVLVRAGDGQIREAFQRYFFCVAGACKDSDVFGWYAIFFCEIFRYNHVVIGYDSFDSSDNKLILNLCFQLFQMSFQIRRGGDENQCIRFLHDIVDVRTESDTLRVEFHPCQIGGIMSKSLKIGDAVVSSHVPINRVFLSQTHLCDGCSPTSSAHYRYLTG